MLVGLRAEDVRDGLTVTLDAELARVTTNETLYSFGDLKIFPLPDGTCPVGEAAICEKGGRDSRDARPPPSRLRRWHGRLTPHPERARCPFHSANRLTVPLH